MVARVAEERRRRSMRRWVVGGWSSDSMSRNGSAILDGLTSLQGSQLALPIATAAGILIVSGVVLPLFRTKKENEIDELGGWSIMTAWPFFEKRYDFLKSNFLKTGKNMFTFKVLQHSVTAVQGEDARVAFFDNRSLSFLEGYRILMGAVPRLQDIDVAPEMNQDVSWFNKMILKLLSRDRLNEVLPSLLDDVQARTLTWGEEGTMDPFKNIYDLVYQMTVRMATCKELASDIDAVTKLQGYFWTCEKAATPTALLLPWFPGSAKKSKEEATKALYAMLWQYVEDRRNAEVPSSDAIDLCIQKEGLDNATTIAFIIGVVFAGVVNTGINSCWVILFLAHHTQWKDAVIKEVQALIKTHTNTTSNEPLHKQLGQIPVSVWEEEMPVMDTIIRETIRLVVNGTALRRNISGELDIAGKNLPEGNFLAYSLTNSHLNESYYTNPTEFDPLRFAPGREEDKNGPYAFVGWGAGRHPCTGMKVAKLEIKVIVAMFVAAYDFSVVDKNGKPPAKLPTPDYNDIQQARPVGEPCFIKFKRVHE